MGGLVLVVGGTARQWQLRSRERRWTLMSLDVFHIKSAISRGIAKNEREKGNSMMSRKERLELGLSIRDTSMGGTTAKRQRKETDTELGRSQRREDGLRRRRVSTLGKVEVE